MKASDTKVVQEHKQILKFALILQNLVKECYYALLWWKEQRLK